MDGWMDICLCVYSDIYILCVQDKGFRMGQSTTSSLTDGGYGCFLQWYSRWVCVPVSCPPTVIPVGSVWADIWLSWFFCFSFENKIVSFESKPGCTLQML